MSSRVVDITEEEEAKPEEQRLPVDMSNVWRVKESVVASTSSKPSADK